MKKKSLIEYPVFLKAIPYIQDAYWGQIFKDLSYGITPYGVFINDHTIECRMKGKEFCYEYSTEGKIEKMYTSIQYFFMDHLKLLSTLDHHLKKIEFNKKVKDLKGMEWCQIKKKSIKDNLIEQFVIRKKDEYALSNHQMKRLLSNILLRFHLRILSTSNILYNSATEEIEEIDHLVFSPHKFTFHDSLLDMEEEMVSNEVAEKSSFLGEWQKFISSCI